MSLPGGADLLGGVDRVAQTTDDVVQALAASDQLSAEGVRCGKMARDDSPQFVEGGHETRRHFVERHRSI